MGLHSKQMLTYLGNNIGDVYPSKFGDFKIVEYSHCEDVTISFVKTGYTCKVTSGSIRRGLVKDHTIPTMYGIGYCSSGKVSDKDTLSNKAKAKWQEMLRRCYSLDFLQTNTSYMGCYVNKDWHDLKVFMEWFKSRPLINKQSNFYLDKDILVFGNKEYSPDCCRLVPREINNLQLFKTLKDPMTGIERYDNGTYRVYCNSENLPRKEIIKTTDLTLAINSFREYKQMVVNKTAIKFRDVLDEDLFNHLLTFKFEEFM